MNKQRLQCPLLLALLAASTSVAWSHDNGPNMQTPQWYGPASLEGVWRVTRHGVNCVTGEQLSTFPVLMTFHAGGTLSGDGLTPGPVPAYAPPEHGLWQQRLGSRNFSFRVIDYSYDDNGAVTGSQEITATGQLTGANAFSYKASVTFYDVDGHTLFSVCGKATGVRFF
jgi:hypothetical protein